MPDEDSKERVDRELLELLNELRVAIPGVQVLFAFLLMAPFSQRFSQTTSFQRGVFLTLLLTCTVASALLIATAAQHRLMFRLQQKEALLQRGNRMAIAGFAALGVSLASGVLLITNFLFGLAYLWFGMALPDRRRGSEV